MAVCKQVSPQERVGILFAMVADGSLLGSIWGMTTTPSNARCSRSKSGPTLGRRQVPCPRHFPLVYDQLGVKTLFSRIIQAQRGLSVKRAILFLAVVGLPSASTLAAETAARPNIVLIYADDLGYGDLGCYGASAVQTPNADRLAREGLRFTSGYCAASTCTPSRYAMMTGQYAFRRKGTAILPGDANLVVPTDRATMPSILARQGYATAVVGKWHLGLGHGKIDWNGLVSPGPKEVGFGYSFIMPATGDRVPCVYLENQRVVGLEHADLIEVSYQSPFPGLPTGVSDRASLRLDWAYGHNMAVVNGVGRIGYMKGGKAALWNDEEMADVFVRKAVEFIESNKDRSFFLYFATHDIHVPRLPNQRFLGRTKMGARGDAIVEFDASVGELLAALDRLQLTDRTLVILSSDNGPVLGDGYKDDAEELLGDHRPAGPLRGGKGSLWEGGTRVPFLVRWPARVKPGVSDAMVSQVDFCASFAALAGEELGADAPDSFNLLPAVLGESREGREYVLEHSGQVALREGPWKLMPTGDPAKISAWALFNLDADLGEQTNLAARHPDVVARLSEKLERLKRQPKTRPE